MGFRIVERLTESLSPHTPAQALTKSARMADTPSRTVPFEAHLLRNGSACVGLPCLRADLHLDRRQRPPRPFGSRERLDCAARLRRPADGVDPHDAPGRRDEV